MQLGTRWAVGTEAPARLPDAVHAAIREVEASLVAALQRSWTLTWLEGLPVVVLDAIPVDAQPVVIRYRPDTDTANMGAEDPDEEWVED